MAVIYTQRVQKKTHVQSAAKWIWENISSWRVSEVYRVPCANFAASFFGRLCWVFIAAQAFF